MVSEAIRDTYLSLVIIILPKNGINNQLRRYPISLRKPWVNHFVAKKTPIRFQNSFCHKVSNHKDC